MQQLRWDEDRVNAELEQKMTVAWDAVYEVHETTKLPMRVAAYVVALRRLADAIKMRI